MDSARRVTSARHAGGYAALNPDRRLAALLLAARFQFELVTRGQCLRAGMSVEQIRHCLRTRRWVRVASGVYQTAPGKSGWEVDAAAALLAVTGRGPTDLRSDKGRLQSPPVALFGTAAARAWEMPGVARAPIQLAISAPDHHTGQGRCPTAHRPVGRAR